MTEMEKRERQEREEWDALPEAEKQEALIASYQSKGITPRFYGVSWENWDTEDKAINAVREGAWKTNLFLCGKSGTGKTHLAMCLTKDGAKYRRLPDIFREVRTDFGSEQDIINRYGTVKLLIIDEVGRQKFSDFEKNLFFEIIDKRWNNVLPTTLITNLNEKEFFSEYGMAILDRLRPAMVRFNWESHRESLNIPVSSEPEKPKEDNANDEIDF
jgi:DNA replication protein DnaC